MPTAAANLSVGIAGWSYADWRDTVYRLPAAPDHPGLFANLEPATPCRYPDDALAFISGYVDMIEVNSSFYRVPSPAATASWCLRTAARPGFFFTAKLNSVFTHEFSRDGAAAAEFRRAFSPMLEADVLRTVLAQFRYDFADSAEAREHLRWVAAEFGRDTRLVLELRHRSWQNAATVELLHELGAGVALLDYPLGRDSFDAQLPLTPGDAYLRLHGRNREKWFARDAAPHEPYNYDYPDAEIEELAGRSRAVLGQVRHLTIVANNHYRGKAVSAALRLKAKLLSARVPVPPALLATYPALQRIAE